MKISSSPDTPISMLKWSRHLCVLIFVINVIFRGWSNDLTAMSRDEPFTLYFSQLSITQFVPIILDTNNPPTFEILLHIWSHLFGNSESALRWLPTLIVSLGSIPFFLLGKRIDGLTGAIVSSALYLGSSLLMNFSHLDRAYCLLVVGSLYMVYFFFKTYEEKKIIHLALWALAALVTCSSHYFGWLMVVTLWVCLLSISNFRDKIGRKMAFTTAILLVCYSPLGFYLMQRFITTHQEGTPVYESYQIPVFKHLVDQYFNASFITTLLSIIGLLVSWRALEKKNFVGGMGMLLCILLLVAQNDFSASEYSTLNLIMVLTLFASSLAMMLSITRGRQSVYEKTIALWVLIPLVGSYFLSMRIQIFTDRYLSFAMAGLLLCITMLVKLIASRAIKYASITLLMAIYFFHFEYTPSYNAENRIAVQTFADYHTKSDLSIVGPGYNDVDFTYYFDRTIFYNGTYHLQDTLGEKLVSESGYTRFKEGLRRELLRNRIVISHDSSNLDIDTTSIRSITYYDGNTSLAYPQNGIIEYLRERYGEPKESRSFSGIYSVYRFSR
jgi:hypothetical protein